MPATANYYAVLSPTGSAASGAALPGPWGPLTTGTSTAGLAEAVAALAAVNGGLLYIEPGSYGSIDWSTMPATVENIQFSGPPSTDGISGSILELTTGVSTATSAFVNCIFENIAFTSPSASSGSIFYGPLNVNNVFRGVTFIDNILHPISYHGPNLWVTRSRFLASASPPSNIDQPIFSPVGPFVCEKCEWNYAPKQGGSGLLIGTNGADTSDGPTGPWWILDNHFLDDNLAGYYSDTAIDIEPTSGAAPNVLRGLFIQRNVIFNGQIALYQGDDVWITDNYHHVTSVVPATSSSGRELVGSLNSGSLPIGTVHIERNHAVQDDFAAAFAPKVISILHNQVREMYIRDNWLIANGKSTGSTAPVGVISIANQGSTSPGIDQVVIEGNTIGITSVPTTKRPALVVAGASGSSTAGTIARVRVLDNRLVGQVSISGLTGNPSTAVDGFSSFLQLGWASWFTNISEAEVYDNNWEDAGGIGPGGIVAAGTLTPSINFIAASRNRTPVLPGVFHPGSIPNGTPFINPNSNAIMIGFYGGTGVSVIAYRGTSLAIIQGLLELGPLESVTFGWTTAPTFYALPK
jgi:hypothetical protein